MYTIFFGVLGERAFREGTGKGAEMVQREMCVKKVYIVLLVLLVLIVLIFLKNL